ncbi:MAG: hypothetical protein ACREKS_10320 [Candidatus Rokuibacteriota bacterium]
MSVYAIRRERVARAVARWPGCLAILLFAMLAVLLLISPADAHQVRPATAPTSAFAEIEDPIRLPGPTRGDGEHGVDRAPGVPPPGSRDRHASAIVLTSLLILMAGVARWRRPVALALGLIALVLTFENGVHSVHHLGSPSEAAHCAVAVAATHSPGVVGEAGVDLGAPLCGRTDAVRARGEAPTLGGHRAFRSRAPPASSLAGV